MSYLGGSPLHAVAARDVWNQKDHEYRAGFLKELEQYSQRQSTQWGAKPIEDLAKLDFDSLPLDLRALIIQWVSP